MTRLPKKLQTTRIVNRWHKTACYLPEPLANKLAILSDSDFFIDDREYWRAIKILDRLYKKYTIYDIDSLEYLPMPSNYIKKIVSSDGLAMWSKLKKTDLIEVHPSNYSTTKYTCFRYRIRPNLMEGLPQRMIYQKTNKRLSKFENKVLKILKKSSLALPQTIEEMVEAKRAKTIVSINYRINEENKTYKPSKGRSYKIKMPISKFIEIKVNGELKAFRTKLENIIYANWRVSRNSTNARLDSNYTNLDAYLHQYITIQNNKTKSIDLCNSQFTLFANILYSIRYNNTILYSSSNLSLLNEFYSYCKMFTMSEVLLAEDVTRFCESAFNGTLYTDIANTIDIDTSLDHETRRKKAKTIAFELFFGSSSFGDSENKKSIKSAYPNVVDIIDGFKASKTAIDKVKYYEDAYLFKSLNKGKGFLQTGYRYFSVMLQQLESRIFIDEIYKPLLDDGQLILSMHDSFIFQEDYEFDITVFDKYLPYGYDLK
ncbi:hypothetical protein N9O51_05020 [Saprospiraceae bacterium]|nr:hypothetical protein [Saprospiraceae bacterium]